MAVVCSLAKLGRHYQLVKNKIPMYRLFPAATVTMWNKDWKPGPYPRTKEERIAAAKKYNLLPEDYEPYPEEDCMGDYPNLPIVSAAARNPFEAYDFPELKRNYGEPLHYDFDLYKEDMLNVEQKFKIPLFKQFIYLTLGFLSFVGFILLGEVFPITRRRVDKQYPRPGIVHYTFEPADETAVE